MLNKLFIVKEICIKLNNRYCISNAMTVIISTRLSDEEYRVFLNTCRLIGHNSEDVLRQIVLDFLHLENIEPGVAEDEQMTKAKDGSVYDSRGRLIWEHPNEDVFDKAMSKTDDAAVIG